MSLPLQYSQTDTPNYGLAYLTKFSEFHMKCTKKIKMVAILPDKRIIGTREES